MLSEYQKELKDKFRISNDTTNKLITSLDNKYRYITYHKNLQLYLSLGMKLMNVYRILEFD